MYTRIGCLFPILKFLFVFVKTSTRVDSSEGESKRRGDRQGRRSSGNRGGGRNMHGLYRKNQLSTPEEQLCTNAFWRKNLFSRYEIKPKYFNVPTYHVKDNANECFERVSNNSWYDTSSFRKKGAFLFCRELRNINWGSSHDGGETHLSEALHDVVEASTNGTLPMRASGEDAKNLDECGGLPQNVVGSNPNDKALNDKASKEKKKKKTLPSPNGGVTPTGSSLTLYGRKKKPNKLAKMATSKKADNVKNEKWAPESCKPSELEPAQRNTHKWDATHLVSGKVCKKKQTSIDIWKYKKEETLKGHTLHEQVSEKIISSKPSVEKEIMCVHKLGVLPLDDKVRLDKSGKGQIASSFKKTKEKSVHRGEHLAGVVQMTPSKGDAKKESPIRSYFPSEAAPVSVIPSGGYSEGGNKIEEKNTPIGEEQIRRIFHPTGNAKSMARETPLSKGTYTGYQQKGRRFLGAQKMLLNESNQGGKAKEGDLDERLSGMLTWNRALGAAHHGEGTPTKDKRIANSIERTNGAHTKGRCSSEYSKKRPTIECMMIEDVDVSESKQEEGRIIGVSATAPCQGKNLHLLEESRDENPLFDSLVNTKMYFRIDFKMYKPILMRAITQVRVYSNEKLLQCVYIKEYPQNFSVVVQNAVQMCNGKVLAKMKNKLIHIKETGVLNFTYLSNEKVIGCSHVSIKHLVSSGLEGGLFISVDDHTDCRKRNPPKEAFAVGPLLPFGRQEINVLKSKIFVNYKIDCPRSAHDFIASGEGVTAKAKITFLEEMVRQMYSFIQDSTLLRFVKGARVAHRGGECGAGKGGSEEQRAEGEKNVVGEKHVDGEQHVDGEKHAEGEKYEEGGNLLDGENHLDGEPPRGRSNHVGNADLDKCEKGNPPSALNEGNDPEGGDEKTEGHLPIGNSPQNGEAEEAADRKEEDELAEKSKSADLEEGCCGNAPSSNHKDPPSCDGVATGDMLGEEPNRSDAVEGVLKFKGEEQGRYNGQVVCGNPGERDNPHVESAPPGQTHNEKAENGENDENAENAGNAENAENAGNPPKGSKDEAEEGGTNRCAPKGVSTYPKGPKINSPHEHKNKKKQIEQLQNTIEEYKKELAEKAEEIQKLKHSNNNTNILYKACYRKLQEIENERKRTDAMNFLLRFDDTCGNKLTNRLEKKNALPKRKAFTETDSSVVMGAEVRRVNSLRSALVALNGEEKNMGGNAIRRSGTGTITGSSVYATTMRSLPPAGREKLSKKKQAIRTESVNKTIMKLFGADLGETPRGEEVATRGGITTGKGGDGDHYGEHYEEQYGNHYGDHYGEHLDDHRILLSNYQIKENKIDALVRENESLKERINKLTLTDAECPSRVPPLKDAYYTTRAKDKCRAHKQAKLRGVEQHCRNSNYLEHSWGEKKSYNYDGVRNKYSSNSRFNFPLNLVKSYSHDPIAHREVDINQSAC
ncbi:hypothetical protein PVNG_00708 [Plasmodium vivax North Korean]|uniref:Uncharacterized protein n=2 Tax=Plasmodium vivax TaxID=5855 RepID=A0A0J9TTN6_PLAVI|nr:hypothetical protein PVNG_00708 [Plasmodium vivax North Korean]